MILVDTSVWTGLLSGSSGGQVAEGDVFQFVTTGPIIQEVLQGMRGEHQRIWFKHMLLAIPRVADPVPLHCFFEAAEIYAGGRRQGYTIRSSTDCLIAAIAIQHNVPVWHRDRDFSAISRFTRLQAYEKLEHFGR